MPGRQQTEQEKKAKVGDIKKALNRIQIHPMNNVMPMTDIKTSESHNFFPYVHPRTCLHCQKILSRHFSSDEHFCCAGCQAIFHLIQQMGLKDFYEKLDGKILLLQRDMSIIPSSEKNDSDDEALLVEFGKNLGSGEWQVDILDPGFDCLACEWLLRQSLIKSFAGVDVAANISENTMTITFKPKVHSLSSILDLIRRLGYAPCLVGHSTAKKSRAGLLRLAVAAFAASNVMMLALAEYFDANLEMSQNMKLTFHLYQAFLAGVSVVFVGFPFYVKAWRETTKARISVDTPLALAFLSIYAWSLWNLFHSGQGVYFDSLTGLLAFLTLGRFLQDQGLSRASRVIEKSSAEELSLEYAHLVGADGLIMRRAPLRDLKSKDVLRVFPGESIPCSATLVSERASLSLEQVTGEILPVVKSRNDIMPLGSINNGQRHFDVCVTDTTKAFSSQQIPNSGQIVLPALSQLFLKYFSVTTLSFATLSAFYGFATGLSWEAIIGRVLAVLIVACPCTFALGIPLILSRAMAKASRKNIFLRDAAVLDRFPQIEKVFFDKTGTLSDGVLSVKHLHVVNSGSLEPLAAALANLDSFSLHPIVHAVASWAREENRHFSQVSDVEEYLGNGLRFSFQEKVYYLGQSTWLKSLGITIPQEWDDEGTFLASENQIQIIFQFEDAWHFHAKELIDLWQKEHIAVFLISGDHPLKVAKAAEALHIPLSHSQGGLLPNQKLAYCLSQLQSPREPFAMIGNGLNDMPAAEKAIVSIAVGNAPRPFRQKASIYLPHHNLEDLAWLRALSRNVRDRIYLCSMMAIIFNVFGLSLAFFGHVTPIWAAVLMPLSSFTIIAIATIW